MSNIIDFPDKRKKELFLSGVAVCISCSYKWNMVALTGTEWLECPSCHCMKGRYLVYVDPGTERWHCKCGNELFYATREGCFCPNCGVWQNFGKN